MAEVVSCDDQFVYFQQVPLVNQLGQTANISSRNVRLGSVPTEILTLRRIAKIVNDRAADRICLDVREEDLAGTQRAEEIG